MMIVHGHHVHGLQHDRLHHLHRLGVSVEGLHLHVRVDENLLHGLHLRHVLHVVLLLVLSVVHLGEHLQHLVVLLLALLFDDGQLVTVLIHEGRRLLLHGLLVDEQTAVHGLQDLTTVR